MDVVQAGCATAFFIGTFYAWPCEFRFAKCVVLNLDTAVEGKDREGRPVFIDTHSSACITRRLVSFVSVVALSAGYTLARAHQRDTVSTESAAPLSFSLAINGDVARCTLSTAALFLGPFFEEGFGNFFIPTDADDRMCFARNFIVCPLGEELFYRGVLYDLLRSRSDTGQILLSSLLFSLSHLHHIFFYTAREYRSFLRFSGYSRVQECEGEEEDTRDSGDDNRQHTREEEARQRACLRCRAWVSGTKTICCTAVVSYVFGILSGVYYLRVCKRNIVAVAATHTLCNLFGPPPFAFMNADFGSPARRAVSAATYCAGIAIWVWCVRRSASSRL